MESRITAGASGRSWSRVFGLHSSAAALAVLVDLMANSASILSMGLLVPVEILCGLALVGIVYKIQRAWYGDDRDSALIKGLVVGLLTAIPVATTPFVLAYAGIGGVLGLGQAPRAGADLRRLDAR
jgi:hypothetical protein